MDVPISIYTSVVKLTGANVPPISLPPSLEETQPAINPPGTSDISGLVPYNGAIDNVDLGEQGLSTGFVKYDNTPTNTPTDSGTVVWNPDKYTLDLSMGLGGSVQQIGMETYYTPVKNQTGSVIPNGTFVMATGSLGASGRMTVAPAVTDGSVDSKYMLGVTTHDIDPNVNDGDGLVTWFGEIRGFNTNTKAPVGETWIDGTVLWNNPAVPGGFTSIEPQAPNLKIPVAIVISAGNNGVIFVRPRLGMRLTDLHDVDAFTPSDKDLISYDSALGHWNAKSLGSVIGGTSSQFLKGDGSLDSNSYALASQINIASGQVAFGTGSGTIGGGNITWNNASNILELIGASTIRTSTGNLVLIASAGNGSVILIPNGSGNTQIRNGGESIRMGADANLTTLSSNTSKRLRISIPQYGNPNSTPIGLISAGSDSSSNGIDIGGIQGGFSLAADEIRVNVGATYNALTQVQVGRFTSTGLGLGNIAPTNTLDVNGTARIRTLSNASGDFVTASATGVLQKRTASETLADIGGIGGTIASGQVAFGTGSNTVGGSSALFFDTVSRRLIIGDSFTGNQGVQFKNVASGTTSGDGTLVYLDDSLIFHIRNFENSDLRFWTNGALRWRISNSGTLYSESSLNLWIGTTSGTNTLDVNGTARIRTLSNATGDFVTASATGVLQKRTASETRTDIGAIGGTIASGQVAFGTGSGAIGGDSGLTWDNVNKILNIGSGGTARKMFLTSSGSLGSNYIDFVNTTGRQGYIGYGNSIDDDFIIFQNKNSPIRFVTNATTRWSVLATGILQSTGTQTIQTSTGNLTLATAGGNGNILLTPNGTGLVGIATTSPTNTLDVNGTARVRTLSNATGDFVTASATGVLQKRTASETLADIGGIGGTIASGQVAFGTGVNTVGGSTVFVRSANGRIGVGVTNPDLYSFNTNTAGWLVVGDPTAFGGISIASSNTSQGYLAFADGSSGGDRFVGEIRYDHAANEMYFRTNGTFAGFIASNGRWLIGPTTTPTNTLDVNGTARIRSLTGTTGYLPLLSSTGVMGQSVVYNTSAGSILIGTINEVSGHKVRISGGALNITNWQSSAGAYDKLSIDFGEFRGIGYDADYNEVFFAGTTTVPVKIDTDAPTDSLNVLSTGGVEMKNLQAGTISDNIGLNSSGELVKGVAGVVQSVSGTAVDNTDPLNPIISVNNWTGETLIDTITLNDTNGNVTYTCNSTISIYTNSKLNIKTLYLNITNIASSGIPLGGAFEIKGYNFYNFIGANDISVLYEVKEFRGTSYTESLLPLLRPDALGTIDGQLIFRKINNTQQQPPFTSTNGKITIKIAKFKQS